MSNPGVVLKTLLVCLFPVCTVFGQVTTVADGPWDDPNTWNPAAVPNSASGTITIDHAVNIPAGYSVTTDQTTVSASGILTIDAGGTLTIANGATDLAINGLVDVYGTLINANGAQITGTDGSNLTFVGGSVFDWRFTSTEGILPLAQWDAASTLLVSGYTTGRTMSNPNWSQAFGNVTWNCTAQAGNIDLAGLVTDIQGNLTILSTGTTTPRFLNLSTTGGITLAIGNDFIISGTSRFQLTTTGVANLTVGGDINFSSTTSTGSFSATSGSVNIDLNGDFIMNAPGGRWRNGSSGTAAATWNIGGDFINNGGTFDEGTLEAIVTLNFTSGTTHMFVNDGTTGIVAGAVRYNIGTNDILDVGTSLIQGSSGSATATSEFNLYGTIRLGSVEPTGALRLATNLGNLRTPIATRVFHPGSTIEYNGLAAQAIGNGHPSSEDVNVIINNPAGVSMAAGAVTIDGDLTLTQGNLTVNSTSAKTLSLGGNLIANGNFISFTGSLSDLTIYGSGDFGVFPFAGVTQLRDFTLDRTAGSVTFNQAVSITRTVTLTAGDLIFAGQTLNLSGTFTSTGGFLSSDASSTLNITGSGAFGTLVFSPAGNNLNTLTFNRTTTGSATIDGTLLVTNTLTLSNGSLTNNAGLILGNGAILTRNSSAALLGNRPSSPAGDLYDVIYTGATMTTGLELPDPSETDDDLNNLTINGGPVTLAQNLIVNGNVDLNNSTFNASTFAITMEGTQWNDNAGNFSPGTGTVIFNGVTTVGGSSIPVFGNVQVNTGATLNLPTGNVNISGNIQFTAGGTVNANGGTVTLTSAAQQNIAGAGMTLHNLTLTKGSSADAALTSGLNLTGLLSISSSNTDFASNGLLTLVSTSDGTTGNASIGPLLNGASVSGNVNVNRYMSAEGRLYRHISSPVTNAPVSQLQDDFPVTGNFTGNNNNCSGCGTNSSLLYFNVMTNAYVGYPTTSNTQTLTPGVGYNAFIRQDILAGPVTIDVTGPINQGTIALPVAYNSSQAESWNLVGNPYPSTIDWDLVEGWTKTNVNPQVAVRDNAAGGVYLYWDGSTGGLTNGLIATGQGFWVRTTAASPSLSINENAKWTSSTGEFHRMEEQAVPDVLIVSIQNNKVWDKAYMRLRPDASNDYDDMDASKLPNDYFNLATKTANGKRVAINALNSIECGSELFLDMSFTKRSGSFVIDPVGNYQLSLETLGKLNGYDVTLVDQFTATSRVMGQNDIYNFSITSDARSYASDRFRIVFAEKSPAANLELLAPSDVCEGSSAEISIAGADVNTSYQVVYKDRVLSELTASTEYAVTINSDLLTEAVNVLQVNAVGSCGTVFPVGEMSISKEAAVSAGVLPVAKICGSGSVELKATGSPTGRYNWYESANASTALAQGTQSYQTPSLAKTKRFFVSAINERGCEGSRTEIIAEVVPIEPITLVANGDQLVTNQSGELEWNVDDQIIEGAKDVKFTPNVSGTYSVSKVVEGCRSTSPKVYFEFLNRGSLPYGVVVYPNPTQESVRVNYPENSKLKRAALFNNAGILISEIQLTTDGSTINGELNVRNLPAGVYIVKIFGENEAIAVKVIKD